MAASRLTDEELANAERSLAWTEEPGSPLDVAKRAITELKEARALLLELEWGGGDDNPQCPYCGQDEHEPYCKLAAAIGRQPPEDGQS
jgi:hypothetical protein